MKINSIVILLAAASAQASTIVNLSNFQAAVDNSISDDWSGGGLYFGGASDLPSTYPGYPTTPGSVLVILDVLGGGQIKNGPVAQFIHATASVDYATPGYHLTSINVFGMAIDDGSGVGENMGITSPCAAGVSWAQSCLVSSSGRESGTFTAYLNMYSDAWIQGWPQPRPNDTGMAGNMQLELTLVPNPEPSTALLIGGALIGLGVIGRKRWIS